MVLILFNLNFSVKTVEDGNIVTTGSFDLGFDVDTDGEVTGETAVNKKRPARKFKESTHDNIINKCSKKIFAPESCRKIKWAVNSYNDWREYRLSLQSPPVEIGRADLNFVGQFMECDLCFALSRFIREIKRIDGSDYPPILLGKSLL